MARSFGRRELPYSPAVWIGVIVAVVLVVVSGWASARPTAPAPSAPPVAVEPAQQNLSGTVLANYSATPWGWGINVPLVFTVPARGAEILYAWSIGGNFTPFTPPTLPAGMHVAASIGFEGMAIGNLSRGSYTTNLSYEGWVNTVTIVVYAFGPGTTLQFRSLSQLNQHKLHQQTVNLTLPAGGSTYVGIESTGGTWPVTNASLLQVDAETPALRFGETGLIGRQSSNDLAFTTIALDSGIVAAAVDANLSLPTSPSVTLLASYSETTMGWALTFPLQFFVPSYVSQVLYVWSIGGYGSNYTLPTLPAGMTIAAADGFEGIAEGNLSSGVYTIGLTYGGWSNTVSLAVYGISGASNVSFSYASVLETKLASQPTQNVTLTLPAGALEYLGVESTGGDLPVENASLAFVSEYTWALEGGLTGEIGYQWTNTFSFTTSDSEGGTIGVAIFANGSVSSVPVTFTAAGLPSGSHWSVDLGHVSSSSASSTLTLASAPGTQTYVVRSPAGYHVEGAFPTGTLDVSTAGAQAQVTFARGASATLKFKETGLTSGHSWCVAVETWTQCTAGRSLSFAGLTPSTYAYEVVPVPQATASLRAGASALPAAGTFDLARSRTLSVHFSELSPVVITEVGLPAGTSWSVTVQGLVTTTTGSGIVLELAVGNHAYKVGAPAGYVAVRSVSRLDVRQGTLSVQIDFIASGAG